MTEYSINANLENNYNLRNHFGNYHDNMNSKSEIHNEESIIIVDFGSQFSHLIARRLREINIYSILISPSSDFDALKRLNPKGIILSGGPYSVYDTNAPLAPDWVYTSNLPIPVSYTHLTLPTTPYV